MASHLPAPGMMRMRMAMESLIVGASLNFIVILLFMYNHNACLVFHNLQSWCTDFFYSCCNDLVINEKKHVSLDYYENVIYRNKTCPL